MTSFLPESVILVDRHPSMVAAWRQAFKDEDSIEVVEGDYFSRPADAMVSPANSFGIMDGGLDAAIRDELGANIQRVVQQVILDEHHGEIPVGQAEVVATSNDKWPHLVIAPTMRVPESVARTTHAYLAFRAALLAVQRFNAGAGAMKVRSMVCCGLGTGIGAMDFTRCAVQMRMAFAQVNGPARIPSFRQIHALHAALVRS